MHTYTSYIVTHTHAHMHARMHAHSCTHAHTHILLSTLGKMPNCTVCGQLYLHKNSLSRHMQLHQEQQTSKALHWPQTTTTTTTTTATTTSMGGAVECYSINMQETQHLNHLLTTLHLLPTMTQFHTKHHPYKFQVAITSVVTQPPVTLTSEMIVVYASDTAPPIDDVNRQLLIIIEVFKLNESGWVFSNFQSLQFTLWQLDPLQGSAFTRLPWWIQARRAVVKVAGKGDDCFKWAILAGMHPVDVNADRRGKYVEHMGKYDFSSLSFPAPLLAGGSFALRNMSIKVCGVDDDKVIYPHHVSSTLMPDDMWIYYCSM